MRCSGKTDLTNNIYTVYKNDRKARIYGASALKVLKKKMCTFFFSCELALFQSLVTTTFPSQGLCTLCLSLLRISFPLPLPIYLLIHYSWRAASSSSSFFVFEGTFQISSNPTLKHYQIEIFKSTFKFLKGQTWLLLLMTKSKQTPVPDTMKTYDIKMCFPFFFC